MPQVIYPTVKAKGAGFVPMITIRAERGQMRGSVVYRGEPRGFFEALAMSYNVATSATLNLEDVTIGYRGRA